MRRTRYVRDVTDADARTFYISTRWGPHNVVPLNLKGTIFMSTLDALPVVVSGAVGSTKSLFDVLTEAYGDNISQIKTVSINVNGISGNYWNPADPHATRVVDAAGHDVSGNVNFDDFKNVQVVVGNNINSNVFMSVLEKPDNGDFVWHGLSVTALPANLDAPNAADHIPTATDIVAAARLIATAENGVFNHNDCHGIASAIAASAGATLDPNSGSTGRAGETPNEQSGFWRIVESNGSAGADWQSKVQPGDIVRMERTDGGVHTITVTAGLNAKGEIQVVDNSNDKISEHWNDYDNDTKPASVTIYRLSPDGMYLTDESKETSGHNIAGTDFNDLINAGTGNDTLSGGQGNDTLDGGAGDDTAVFSGKQSDYKISVSGNTATLTDLRAGTHDGIDTIKNIEHVKFGDGSTVNFGDLKTTVVAPPPPPPPPPPVHVAGSVSIGDVTITEGANGSHTETFTVKRTGGDAAFDVNFATKDGSATVADGDYKENHGTLHFAAGVDSQTISVVVNGDTKVESNETFNVNLSGATNGAAITKAQGVGTIVNDDVAPAASTVSISDATITEGNNGTHIETFTVTRNGGNAAFDVHYATQAGTASAADGDYVGKSGDLHFAAGVNSQTISIVVNGDTKVEANETFKVNLSAATNGTTIADGQGVGTIVNDDVAKTAGSVSISDATITEGNNGTHTETFTVTRSAGSAAFDVHFATQAGTASAADGDYVGKSGDLHFAEGVNSQTISIVVNGDTKVEANETFKVNLSAATNGAAIADGQGVGTIVNDDAAPTHHVANDFNGDGMSDLLLGKTNGSLALWELNGNHVDANVTVGAVVPAGWHIDGIADFNNDGKSDVLLHNDSGKVAMWEMDGNHVTSNTTVGSVGSDWHVIGTADFSGDGKADIMWENSKGQVAMWQMDGDHVVSNTSVSSIGSDWKVIGTDDFNGDGRADVLWENAKGQVAMWQMDGNHVTSNTAVASIGSDWHAAGTGDFNGDGKADVLWQNDKGSVARWQMDGNHIASNTSVGPAAGWSVIGTGDYNHDGKADVLFENAAGKVAQWQMDGDHIVDNLTVASHSTDWHHV
jgi:Calx-beta domain/FG-GAP-like repeat/RTX calcium-binding nonapeptide repeat (4 copies)